MSSHLLIGSSFVDPLWQDVETWAVQYSKIHPSYIVAKAGMGIKGVCTEALYYLEELNNISKVIVMLPDLWKIDIEIDEETYISNSMTDLLWADYAGVVIKQKAHRKWITSGSMVWDKKTEAASIFNFVSKHQGFLVLVKEHFRELKRLIDTCRYKNISCYITTTTDPLSELSGLDYIRPQVEKILQDVSYDSWMRFDGKFVDDFLQLKHNNHPTAQEHAVLCKYIFELTNKER
jgi:hypothetical protein